MEGKDEVKQASQACNDVISVSIVPPAETKADKGVSGFDVTHITNFKYHIVATILDATMRIN
jgi:hypothetical protein